MDVMRRQRALAIGPWVAGLWGILGCATPDGTSDRKSAPSAAVAASLSLPPSHTSEATWHRLAASQSCSDRWQGLRYLLDLRDLAWALGGITSDQGRRARDDAATMQTRRTLSRLLGRPSDATTGVVAVDDDLKARLIALQRRCVRFARHARAARTLLETDASPRTPLARALAVTVAYKRVLRADGELAPNARLRLVRWCSGFFHRAVRAEPSQQQRILNRCLFPLFEADPRPYFGDDPSTRPPDPPWPILRARLRAVTNLLMPTRFVYYARRQRLTTHQLLERTGSALPSAFGPRAFDLRPSDEGRALDRIPVVAIRPAGYVVDNQAVGLEDPSALESAIARRRAGDGPSAIVIVCNDSTSLDRVFAVGRAAHRAAVKTLHLGVRRRVADRPPAGDVQSAIAKNAPVWRLEGIPLSLRLLGTKQRGAPSRQRAKALGYDARGATAGLALSLRPGRFQLSSVDGTLPAKNLAELTPALRMAHRAYPMQMSLVLAAAEALTYGELVEVARRARFHDHGPLFPGLALTRLFRISRREADISRLLAALGQSYVSATPLAGTPALLLEGAHGCYRAALRRAFRDGRPWPEGRAVLGASGPPRLRAAGLRDGKFGGCLAELMARHASGKVPPVSLDFAPGAASQ